jgi:hypothetical protein
MSDGPRNDEAVVSLVVDASGLRRGSDEATAFGKRILDSLRGVSQAAKDAGADLTESSNKVVKGLNDQSRFLNQVAREVNPFKTALDEAANRILRLNGIIESGGLGAKRAGELLGDYAKKVADLQRAYTDASTHVDAWAKNQAAATNIVIENLKRYQVEQAKVAQEQMKFAQQIAPSSNIAEHTAMVNKMIDNLKRYQSEQEKAFQDQFKFTQQIAPQSNIADHNKQQQKDAKDAADALKNIRNSQLVEEKHQFDLETSYYEKLAATQKKNISETIVNLKAYQAEQARATVEAEKFTKGFFTATAPQSSIATHNKELKDAEDKTRKFNDAQKDLTGTSRATQYALTNLSFQVNDVVSGLAMGQGGFRIFAQQAGQFVQVFQQGGGIKNVLEEAATAVGKWTTSVAAWVATVPGALITGATLIAGAFAVILTRTISNESQLRRFNAALGDVNLTTNTSSVGLQKLSFDLRAVGVSADDAEKSLLLLSRNLSINLSNPNAIRNISQVGLDVGARLGIGDATGIARVNEAISSQSDLIVKLGLETRAFSADEAAAFAIDIQRGNGLKAVEQAFKLLGTRLDGVRESSLSQMEKSVDSVAAAFNKFLNAASDTSLFKTIHDSFVGLLHDLTEFVSHGTLPESHWFKILLAPIPGGSVLNALIALKGLNSLIPESLAGAGEQRTIFGQGFSANGARNTQTPLSIGGALQAANVNNKDIVDLQTVFAQRVDAFLAAESEVFIKSAARFGSHPSEFNPSGFGLHNADILGAGLAVDLGNLSQAAAARLRTFGLHQTVPGDWGHVEPFEIPTATQATGAARMAAGRAFVGANSGLTSATSFVSRPSLNGTTAVVQDSTAQIEKQKTAIASLTDEQLRAVDTAGLWNIKQQAMTAFNAKYAEVLGTTHDVFKAWEQANVEFDKTRDVALVNLNKEVQLTDLKTQGDNKSAEALKNGTAAGLQTDAAEQARIKNLQTGIDTGTAYRQILQGNAAEAVKSAREQLAAQMPVIEGQKNLANATKIGAQAEHDVRVQNEANVLAQRAIDAEKAAGKTISTEYANAIINEAKAQIIAKEATTNSIATIKELNQAKDTQQQLQLQIQLQGQTTEEINRQVALLQKKQELDRDTTGLSQQEKDARLAGVDATQKQIIALTEAQRQQARIEDAVKGIANTVDTTLTQSIEDAFSGQKVDDWGTRIKKMLGSLVSQISDALFIKPLIGSLLGSIGGLGNVASGFGNLFGSSSGGIFGSGNNTLTGTVGGQPATFSLGNVANVASIGKSAGLFDNLFGTGTGNSFFSNIGSNLGFASSQSASSVFGIESSTLNSLGLTGNVSVPGSIFGGTTLGGLLGGVGAGFGAGSLLNSLLGGNTLTGTIGSGVGSIAGSLVGSFLFPGIGTILGGLLGGAGGGLFGLFGNSKPSNASAGGNIDFATGRVSGTFQGGNSSIDQTTLQAVQTIGQFTQTLLKASGGTLSGQVLLQNGVNTGFTADSSLPGFEGRFNLGKDATNAINEVELALSRSIQGISDNMKNVINSITDPSQLEAAIQFVGIYDNMKKAADSAFASISTDTDQIGPFATALNNINELFKGITDSANQFGLSLDPVNASLAEATKRLTEDFNTSINDAILAITDPTQQALDIEKRAGDARIKEAQAVAGDMDKVNQLNALMIDQITKQTSDQIAQTAEDIKNSFQSVDDFRKSVQFGELSGLTSQQKMIEGMNEFNQAFAAVAGGDLSKINDLISFGQSTIQLSTQNTGNDTQTGSIRAVILNDLNSILAGKGFASGSNSTPPGWIQVHKDEWMFQQGGSVVVPKGQSVLPGVEELTEEMMKMRGEQTKLLASGNRLAAEVGTEVVKQLSRQTDLLSQTPIYQPTRNAV